mgnify:CR=1 FL=1
MDKVSAIKLSALSILDGRIDNAKNIINKEYPFKKIIPKGEITQIRKSMSSL